MGIILGNLDPACRTFFGKAAPPLIPFFAFALVVPLVTAWWAGRVGSPPQENEELASERNPGVSETHADIGPPKPPF